MKGTSLIEVAPLALAVGLGVHAGQARAQDMAVPVAPSPPIPTQPYEITADARLDALQRQLNEQTQRLQQMRELMQAQEQQIFSLQNALNDEILANARARGAPAPVIVPSLNQAPTFRDAPAGSPTYIVVGPSPASVSATPALDANPQVAQSSAPPRHQQAANPQAQSAPPAGGDAQAPQRVGQAPESDSRPPEVAQIFDQPGVLTPKGKLVVEPAIQYGYSANDRVALVGYTIIPAILIGLIDVRQVKTTTAVATLTGRYGVSRRMEVEARLPYVYIHSDTVSREIFTGSAQDRVFNARGSGMGDVELTGRYQLNRGGADKPFYIAWLRYKSRTGRDLFDVTTDCVTRCVANTTGTGLPLDLPTGSGFNAVQPGITWLYPSDPVVFFGSLSYLHNFKRSDVSRRVLGGQTEFLGDIKAGDILGFNLGMGLALNEKAAISIGYDTSIVDMTKQNGEDVAGAVRTTLGTLLLGGTYRFSDRMSLNVALGVGITRDTPDMTFTARLPINF
ncbi:TolA-binding protein [Pseudoxanthomonas japonensis]|uniref:transporter n=1 Tax=Pseudoxanthomonas japonensis TaxID=69284 RepID=UPI002862865F|nr:transporter [Pseudoxanthomonas japonensis]MDR7070331.1 TolA-binding protein [Pseudoxanthomonas japonensis]